MKSYREKADGLGENAIVSAARMRDELAWKLGTDPQMPPETAEDMNDAMDVLEQRFPALADIPIGEAEEFASGQGYGRRGERRSQPQGRPRPRGQGKATRAKATQEPRRGSGAGLRSSGRPRKGRRRGYGRAGRYASRSYEQTGIPGAGRSISRSVMQLLGMTVGLSLVYLLLSNAQGAKRGRSAVEQAGTGLSLFLRKMIAPVDPLTPQAKPLTPAQVAKIRKGMDSASAGVDDVASGVSKAAKHLKKTAAGARPLPVPHGV